MKKSTLKKPVLKQSLASRPPSSSSSDNTLLREFTHASDQVGSVIRQRSIYTRIFAILFLLLSLVGFWWPFAQVNTSLSLNGPFGGHLVVLPENTQVTQVTAADFLVGKQLPAFDLFGQTIDSYTIGNYRLYDLLKNPLQDYGYLQTATQLISPETASLISSPQLLSTLTHYFPDYATDIHNALQGAANIVGQASQVVTALNNIVIAARQESLIISQSISFIQSALQVANFTTIFLFVLIIGAIIALCFPRVSKVFSLIIVSVVTLVVALAAILTTYYGQVLARWNTTFVASLNTQFQRAITDLINQLLGNAASLLNWLGSDQINYLDWQIHLHLQTGAILMLAGLVGALILIIFIPAPALSRRRTQKKSVSLASHKTR